MQGYEKTGYLTKDFQIFHLKSQEERAYAFHFHDFHKILFLLNGNVTYSIEGKTYELSPFDLVMIPKGQMHRPVVHNDSPYERIIIYISPDFLKAYSQEKQNLSSCFEDSFIEKSHVIHLSVLNEKTLITLLHTLASSLTDTDFAHELHQKLLFLEFMIQLNRTILHSKHIFSDTVVSNPKIVSILSYINTNLTQELSIDALAERFYTSRYHLMHSFKLETGYSIGQYITTKRLLLAQEYIKNDMPVMEACLCCGFQNYSTFSRAYKKNFGLSPTKQKENFFSSLLSPDEVE